MNPSFAFGVGDTVAHKTDPGTPMVVVERSCHEDGTASSWNEYLCRGVVWRQGAHTGGVLTHSLFELELIPFVDQDGVDERGEAAAKGD